MKPPKNSSREKTTLPEDNEELIAQARDILRTSSELLEKLKTHMGKIEEVLKRKENP
jgi:hypothetical protein